MCSKNSGVSSFSLIRNFFNTDVILFETMLPPLPQGERELHKFPLPLMEGGEGEGDDVDLFNLFDIVKENTQV
jgi:hypothetical protein